MRFIKNIQERSVYRCTGKYSLMQEFCTDRLVLSIHFKLCKNKSDFSTFKIYTKLIKIYWEDNNRALIKKKYEYYKVTYTPVLKYRNFRKMEKFMCIVWSKLTFTTSRHVSTNFWFTAYTHLLTKNRCSSSNYNIINYDENI